MSRRDKKNRPKNVIFKNVHLHVGENFQIIESISFKAKNQNGALVDYVAPLSVEVELKSVYRPVESEEKQTSNINDDCFARVSTEAFNKLKTVIYLLVVIIIFLMMVIFKLQLIYFFSLIRKHWDYIEPAAAIVEWSKYFILYFIVLFKQRT